MPAMTLMSDIAVSVNDSHLNLSELSESMLDAIDHTIQAAQQVSWCFLKDGICTYHFIVYASFTGTLLYTCLWMCMCAYVKKREIKDKGTLFIA